MSNTVFPHRLAAKVFIWTDGSKMDYSNWQDNKPDDTLKDNDCVFVDADTREWTNDLCIDKFNSIVCKAKKRKCICSLFYLMKF